MRFFPLFILKKRQIHHAQVVRSFLHISHNYCICFKRLLRSEILFTQQDRAFPLTTHHRSSR